MNNEKIFEANNCVEEVVEVIDMPDTRKADLGKKIGIILGVTGLTAAVAVIAKKQKSKIENFWINRLRKKGYSIVPPLDDIDCGDENNEDDVKSKQN